MNNEKRYSVWMDRTYAMKHGPAHGTWHEAKASLDAWQRGNGSAWRIWDHATTPPTDVTDAEPEFPWWFCRWGVKTPFECTGGYDVKESNFQMSFRNGLTFTCGYIQSATEPTLAEFRTAVKDATGVEIPEPEAPQLWVWDVRNAEWSVHAYSSTHPPYAEVTTCGPNGTVENLYVTATTKTRDALRDEALSWAARAAGKGGEE